jgi:hypothetical protein
LVTIELTLPVISVGITIFVIIIGVIIWAVRLHWKISQMEEMTKKHEEKITNLESKINVSRLAMIIDDYIELKLKLNAYNQEKSKLDNTGDKK